ncbi:MAG: carbon storage regulator CsrA [Naasia sp.]|jgi:carbon storage regulator|uniref:carbon storage regulator CsrA n=1 Tax=Naasia sp. TaxID=2546198 RepID=UPI002633915F|nr:carbon storage regulator CsrA [Naasia sp.]MCU1570988.1 carbon storage regulator CsrA [Naasia sp.]
MLVLTRKKGERVMIGDDIVITVIDIRGDGIRIGFDAPRGVSIQRAEVLSAVSAANTEAASIGAAEGVRLVDLLTKPPVPSDTAAAVPAATDPAVTAAAVTGTPEK